MHVRKDSKGKDVRRADFGEGPVDESAGKVQLAKALEDLPVVEQLQALSPSRPLQQKTDDKGMPWLPSPVQTTGGGASADSIKQTAASGFSGSSGPLPHLDKIQESFGSHDVSGVKAHVGGPAADANTAMGAEAYASGDKVAFKDSPSLHTAAHEATHVIQQGAGVSLKDGVGQHGDKYERHADKVADKVVRGESAQGLLDATHGSGSTTSRTTQTTVQGDAGALTGLPYTALSLLGVQIPVAELPFEIKGSKAIIPLDRQIGGLNLGTAETDLKTGAGKIDGQVPIPLGKVFNGVFDMEVDTSGKIRAETKGATVGIGRIATGTLDMVITNEGVTGSGEFSVGKDLGISRLIAVPRGSSVVVPEFNFPFAGGGHVVFQQAEVKVHPFGSRKTGEARAQVTELHYDIGAGLVNGEGTFAVVRALKPKKKKGGYNLMVMPQTQGQFVIENNKVTRVEGTILACLKQGTKPFIDGQFVGEVLPQEGLISGQGDLSIHAEKEFNLTRFSVTVGGKPKQHGKAKEGESLEAGGGGKKKNKKMRWKSKPIVGRVWLENNDIVAFGGTVPFSIISNYPEFRSIDEDPTKPKKLFTGTATFKWGLGKGIELLDAMATARFEMLRYDKAGENSSFMILVGQKPKPAPKPEAEGEAPDTGGKKKKKKKKPAATSLHVLITNNELQSVSLNNVMWEYKKTFGSGKLLHLSGAMNATWNHAQREIDGTLSGHLRKAFPVQQGIGPNKAILKRGGGATLSIAGSAFQSFGLHGVNFLVSHQLGAQTVNLVGMLNEGSYNAGSGLSMDARLTQKNRLTFGQGRNRIRIDKGGTVHVAYANSQLQLLDFAKLGIMARFGRKKYSGRLDRLTYDGSNVTVKAFVDLGLPPQVLAQSPGIRLKQGSELGIEMENGIPTGFEGTIVADILDSKHKPLAEAQITVSDVDLSQGLPLISGSVKITSARPISLMDGKLTLAPGAAAGATLKKNQLESLELQKIGLKLMALQEKGVDGYIESAKLANTKKGPKISLSGGSLGPLYFMNNKLEVGLEDIGLTDSKDFTATVAGKYKLNEKASAWLKGKLSSANNFIPEVKLGGKMDVNLLEGRPLFKLGDFDKPKQLLDFAANFTVVVVPCSFGIEVGTALQAGTTDLVLSTELNTEFFSLDPEKFEMPDFKVGASLTGGLYAMGMLQVAFKGGVGMLPYAFVGIKVPATGYLKPTITGTGKGTFESKGGKLGGDLDVDLGLATDLDLSLAPCLNLTIFDHEFDTPELFEKKHTFSDLLGFSKNWNWKFGPLHGEKPSQESLTQDSGGTIEQDFAQKESEKASVAPATQPGGALPGTSDGGGMMDELKHVTKLVGVVGKFSDILNVVQKAIRFEIPDDPGLGTIEDLVTKGVDLEGLIGAFDRFEQACREAEESGALQWLQDKLPEGWKFLPDLIRYYLDTVDFVADGIEAGMDLLGFDTPEKVRAECDARLAAGLAERGGVNKVADALRAQGIEFTWAKTIAKWMHEDGPFGYTTRSIWAPYFEIGADDDFTEFYLSFMENASLETDAYAMKLRLAGVDRGTIEVLKARYFHTYCQHDYRIDHSGIQENEAKTGRIKVLTGKEEALYSTFAIDYSNKLIAKGLDSQSALNIANYRACILAEAMPTRDDASSADKLASAKVFFNGMSPGEAERTAFQRLEQLTPEIEEYKNDLISKGVDEGRAAEVAADMQTYRMAPTEVLLADGSSSPNAFVEMFKTNWKNEEKLALDSAGKKKA